MELVRVLLVCQIWLIVAVQIRNVFGATAAGKPLLEMLDEENREGMMSMTTPPTMASSSSSSSSRDGLPWAAPVAMTGMGGVSRRDFLKVRRLRRQQVEPQEYTVCSRYPTTPSRPTTTRPPSAAAPNPPSAAAPNPHAIFRMNPPVNGDPNLVMANFRHPTPAGQENMDNATTNATVSSDNMNITRTSAAVGAPPAAIPGAADKNIPAAEEVDPAGVSDVPVEGESAVPPEIFRMNPPGGDRKFVIANFPQLMPAGRENMDGEATSGSSDETNVSWESERLALEAVLRIFRNFMRPRLHAEQFNDKSIQTDETEDKNTISDMSKDEKNAYGGQRQWRFSLFESDNAAAAAEQAAASTFSSPESSSKVMSFTRNNNTASNNHNKNIIMYKLKKTIFHALTGNSPKTMRNDPQHQHQHQQQQTAAAFTATRQDGNPAGNVAAVKPASTTLEICDQLPHSANSIMVKP
ncbi:unnamed protein product [Notodromas monacha]|uniref:Uncharacterized protein n=1 Tax=Notodromas monacha TaxID=399045 RepID=A0A7R9GHZ5_9CRUS|nr:unnamed protein product [Notodromas monacha]CAG0923319.1 unnamed protein product [Notodromas monacha]